MLTRKMENSDSYTILDFNINEKGKKEVNLGKDKNHDDARVPFANVIKIKEYFVKFCHGTACHQPYIYFTKNTYPFKQSYLVL